MKKINLDFVRLIASICIVAIHIYPFNNISELLDYQITRVFFRQCVPIFLMITGYFLIPKILKDKQKLKDYLKKISIIYLFAIFLYLPLNIYKGDFLNINLLTIFKSIFLNGTFYHLWYFPALIIGIITIYFLLKKFSKKTCLVIVLIGYLIGLFGDSYYGLLQNVFIFNKFYEFIFQIFSYTRNIFYTPIFLFIGYCCYQKKTNLSFRKNLLFYLIFLLILEIEGYLLYYFNIPRHSSMYLSLPIGSYLLFQLLLNLPKTSSKKMRSIGTLIYIFHPLVIVLVRLLGKIFNLEKIIVLNNFFNYIVVVIISLIISIVVNKIIERIYLWKKNLS